MPDGERLILTGLSRQQKQGRRAGQIAMVSLQRAASPVLRRVARRPVLELACHLLQSGSAQAWPSFVFIIGPG